jgi:hypothetical protein
MWYMPVILTTQDVEVGQSPGKKHKILFERQAKSKRTRAWIKWQSSCLAIPSTTPHPPKNRIIE